MCLFCVCAVRHAVDTPPPLCVCITNPLPSSPPLLPLPLPDHHPCPASSRRLHRATPPPHPCLPTPSPPRLPPPSRTPPASAPPPPPLLLLLFLFLGASLGGSYDDSGIRAEIRSLAAAFSDLQRSLSSSFLSSPFGELAVLAESTPLRPTRATGGNRIRGDSKASKYTFEWDRKMKQFPENSHYRVYHSPHGNNFQLLYYQQDDASGQVVYECIGSHEAIKSAFFVFGMKSYNCEDFISHNSVEGIPMVGELSPERTAVSYHPSAPPDV